jgi:hypothetical protein
MIIKTLEGISALIYSLVFILLSVIEVYSYAANAGRSIKEANSIGLWIN